MMLHVRQYFYNIKKEIALLWVHAFLTYYQVHIGINYNLKERWILFWHLYVSWLNKLVSRVNKHVACYKHLFLCLLVVPFILTSNMIPMNIFISWFAKIFVIFTSIKKYMKMYKGYSFYSKNISCLWRWWLKTERGSKYGLCVGYLCNNVISIIMYSSDLIMSAFRVKDELMFNISGQSVV